MDKRLKAARIIRVPVQATPAPDDDYWYMPFGLPASSGIKVTPDLAMRLNAVMSCVRVLAETVASLPLFVYHRRSDGGKDRVTDHRLYGLLHNQPNQWQTSFEWREMMMGHLALRGNAYSEKVGGLRGSVDQLVPLHPDNVEVEKLESGQLRYKVRRPDGTTIRTLNQDRVLHLRGLSSDGVKGLSPIELASESVGTAMATETYCGEFFENQAMPATAIKHPGKLSENAQGRMKESWKKTYAGPGRHHETAILEEGMDVVSLGVSNKDAQFLEVRNFQVEDIARIYRVPPHMIGHLTHATFSNIEHQSIDFVVHTIRPWLVRCEQAMVRDLFDGDDNHYAEFLVDGLLRGDAEGRAKALQIQFRNGALSQDEWRAIENRNALPDGAGKTYYVSADLEPANQKGSKEEPESEPEPQVPQLPFEPQRRQPGSYGPPGPPPDTFTGNDDNNITIFIEDAAKRLASAQLRELEKHVPKAAEDRERFNVWVAEFYDGHRDYVAKVITPLARARSLSGHEPDVEGLIDSIVTHSRDAIINADQPWLVLKDLKENGPEWIASQLQKGLDNHATSNT